MRVSIITCSNVDNHGARLQTYALARHLLSQGNEVQVIDYRPAYMSPGFRVFYRPKGSFREWIKYCLRIPRRIRSRKRHERFVKFSDSYIPLTPKVYRSVRELRDAPPAADLYLAGSDQIWNTFFPNGTDSAFYLDFGPDSVRRESFAASFGTDALRPGTEGFVRKQLARFDRISVREQSGLRILEDLGIEGGTKQDDPVFLLSAGQWSQLSDGTGEGERYLLVYDFFPDPKLRKKAQELARQRNLRIYAICPFRTFYAHRDFPTAGPQTFIALVKNASLVVTNSFHAIAFCMIFDRPYEFVERPDGLNGRMNELIRDRGGKP